MPDTNWELLSKATIRRMIWGVDARDSDPLGLNDEFDDGSFTGWTIVEDTAPNLVVSEGGDCLLVHHPGGDAAGEMHGIVKAHALAVGDYVQAAFEGNGQSQNYNIAGVVISNGATFGAGTQQALYLSPQEAAVSWGDGTNWTAAVSSIANVQHQATGIIHLRLEYESSNNFKAWVSGDGAHWNELGTRGRTLTPSHVGVFFTTWGGANEFQWRVPYVRFGTV